MWVRERIALIKSLITGSRKDMLEAQLQKIDLNMSADNITYVNALVTVYFIFHLVNKFTLNSSQF